MPLKNHGITQSTPENLILGAGTFYRNLKWEGNDWANDGVLGATNGGCTVTITPEYLKVQVDGATVNVRGLTRKVAEAMTAALNLTEYSGSAIAEALHLEIDDGATGVPAGYTAYKSKRDIEDGDYFENLGYVGFLTSGEPIIIIIPNALCTSAFSHKGQNKTQATFELTYEAHADFEQADLSYIPYKVYYPESAAEDPDGGDGDE